MKLFDTKFATKHLPTLQNLLGTKSKGGIKSSYAVSGSESATFTKDRSIIYRTSYNDTVNPTTYTQSEVNSLARYMVSNDALVTRLLNVTSIYSIGTGLIPNATTGNEEFDIKANEAFDNWGSSVFCDASNHQNLWEMQHTITKELLLTGNVYIVLSKSKSGFPQIQLFAAESCKNSGKPDDKSIDGINYNESGVAISYVIDGNIIDAANVIHLVKGNDFVGAKKGKSAFYCCMNDIRDWKNLLEAEILSCKLHANVALQIARNSNDNAQGAFGEDLLGEQKAQKDIATPNPIAEKIYKGAVLYTDENEKINLLASERTSEGFVRTNEILLRKICMAVGCPYEFIYNSEKLSGTSVRLVLQDFAYYVRSYQDTLLEGMMQRLYAWVIASLIKDGKLPKQDNYWKVKFVRPMLPTVDAGRQNTSTVLLMQNGLLNLDTYYSQLGLNWKDEIKERVNEISYMKKLCEETGIDLNLLLTLQAGSSQIAKPETPQENL